MERLRRCATGTPRCSARLDLADAFLAVASGCANFGTRGGVKFDLHRFSSARALPITFSSGIGFTTPVRYAHLAADHLAVYAGNEQIHGPFLAYSRWVRHVPGTARPHGFFATTLPSSQTQSSVPYIRAVLRASFAARRKARPTPAAKLRERPVLVRVFAFTNSSPATEAARGTITLPVSVWA
jgi:hypothetical protein